MPVSERFLALVSHQLNQFVDCHELRSLVVYVTHQDEGGRPTLLPVGQWPGDGRSLPALEADRSLRMPAEERRWLYRNVRHLGLPSAESVARLLD